MPLPQSELDIEAQLELEDVLSEKEPALDPKNCPSVCGSIFQSAANPAVNTLNLSKKYIYPENKNITYIRYFLFAYPHLRILDLSDNPLIRIRSVAGALSSTDVLNALGGITTLHTLILSNTQLDYRALFEANIFRQNKTLKHLNFSNNNLAQNTDAMLLWLEEEQAKAEAAKRSFGGGFKTFIQSVVKNIYFGTTFSMEEVGTDAASLFAKMSLESLNLSNTNINVLGRLASSRTLASLNIAGNAIPESEIISLVSNTRITSLNLANCGLYLSFLPKLRTANQNLTTLNFSGFKHQHLQRYVDVDQDLEEERKQAYDKVDANEREIRYTENKAFSALAKMPYLQSLTMDNGFLWFLEVYCPRLAESKSLQFLSMKNCKITTVEPFKDIQVTHLDLSDNLLFITDYYRELNPKILAAMPKLRCLNITKTHLSIRSNRISCEEAKLLLDKTHQNTKPESALILTFLMGTHPRAGAKSSIHAFVKADNFDRNMLKEILSFWAVPAFELIHDFYTPSEEIQQRHDVANDAGFKKASVFAENRNEERKVTEEQNNADAEIQRALQLSSQEKTPEQKDEEELNAAIALSLKTAQEEYVCLHNPSGVCSSSSVQTVQPIPKAAPIQKQEIVGATENPSSIFMDYVFKQSSEKRAQDEWDAEDEELKWALELSLQEAQRQEASLRIRFP